MCAKPRGFPQGFSLIEVMISLTLIGFSALALMRLQSDLEQRAQFAVQSTQALSLAEQKLEWFRTRGASSAGPAGAVADFDHDLVSGEAPLADGFILSWTVSDPILSGSLKNVHIEVTWYDRQGTRQWIGINTAISRFSEFDR